MNTLATAKSSSLSYNILGGAFSISWVFKQLTLQEVTRIVQSAHLTKLMDQRISGIKKERPFIFLCKRKKK